jgi:hypothetical protein
MAKITDLGWAKPDDPIYSSGPMINFRPPLPESTQDAPGNKGGKQTKAKKRVGEATECQSSDPSKPEDS